MTPARITELKAMCVEANCLGCDAPGENCPHCGGTHRIVQQPHVLELVTEVERLMACATQTVANDACERLPLGYLVTCDLENGAGSVLLLDPSGDVCQIDDYDPSDEPIDAGIRAAVATAIRLDAPEGRHPMTPEQAINAYEQARCANFDAVSDERDRLAEQARDISTRLSDAGVHAMPIPEGVGAIIGDLNRVLDERAQILIGAGEQAVQIQQLTKQLAEARREAQTNNGARQQMQAERDAATRAMTTLAKDLNEAFGSAAIDAQEFPRIIATLRHVNETNWALLTEARRGLRLRDECVVCKAILIVDEPAPHCHDCIVEDEHEDEWRESQASIAAVLAQEGARGN